MTKQIVHIDMDDTLCDYQTSFNFIKKSDRSIEYPQSLPGFFENLVPIHQAIDSVKHLMEYYDIYILTRPSYMNPLCYTEKRLWIEKYFGLEMCKRLIICPNKALVKGDYLIDDVLWPEFEGEQIQFSTVEFSSWSRVSVYLLDKFYKNERMQHTMLAEQDRTGTLPLL